MTGYKPDKMGQRETEKMQLKMLRKQLRYVYGNSRFYRKKFDRAGIKPEDIRTFDDFRRIPFTTKEELRKHNRDFICRPMEDIVDIGTTTGTSGTPVILPVTGNDWENLLRIQKTAVDRVGITKHDVVQLTMAFDQLFSVSTPMDDVFKRMGATSVRTGPGNTLRQIEIMKMLNTTVMYATPDYMLILAEKAREMGYRPDRDFKLRKAVLVGQPLYRGGWKPTDLKKRIEKAWNIETFSNYGSMEMLAGFHECTFHRGHHTFPDYIYVEIIDPSTGEVLGPGEEGEIVSTHLAMEGVPLVRFRQGDTTSVETERCACGRMTPRVMAVLGRADNMLKIRGTSIYPQQIEDVMVSVPGVNDYVIEAFKNEKGFDDVRIKVSVNKQGKDVIGQLAQLMKARIRITPKIEVSDQKAISGQIFKNGTRKPKRFWDCR